MTGPADAAPALGRGQLLSVYLLTPTLLAVGLLDGWWGGGAIRDALPSSPAALPFYTLVFGIPHVLAGFFLLADRDLARDTRRIVWPSMALAGAAALAAVAFLDPRQLGLAMVVTTMVHVLGQQTGLAAGQAGLRAAGAPRGVGLWRALLAGTGLAAGAAVGGESLVPVVDSPQLWLQAAGVFLLVSTPLAAWLGYAARRRGGDVRALLSIQATITAGYGLLLFGYPVLCLWLFRFVHDVTAFMVYGTVARTRALAAPRSNRLYALLGLRGAWLGWALWPLASVLTALGAVVLPPVFFIAVVWAHYLAEHRLWRRGSPLRQWLPMQ
jgi:hypothetical protein